MQTNQCDMITPIGIVGTDHPRGQNTVSCMGGHVIGNYSKHAEVKFGIQRNTV